MGAACSTCAAGTDAIVVRPLVEPQIFSAAEAEQHLDARAPGEWVLRNPPLPAENQTTTEDGLMLSLKLRGGVIHHELGPTGEGSADPAALQRTFLPALTALVAQLAADPHFLELDREALAADALPALLLLRPYVVMLGGGLLLCARAGSGGSAVRSAPSASTSAPDASGCARVAVALAGTAAAEAHPPPAAHRARRARRRRRRRRRAAARPPAPSAAAVHPAPPAAGGRRRHGGGGGDSGGGGGGAAEGEGRPAELLGVIATRAWRRRWPAAASGRRGGGRGGAEARRDAAEEAAAMGVRRRP